MRRELVMQQERDKKSAEFEQQIDRVNTNLDFKRSKDTQKNIHRWERAVQDDEDGIVEHTDARQVERVSFVLLIFKILTFEIFNF
jgi:structural maintenance of chromosome 1